MMVAIGATAAALVAGVSIGIVAGAIGGWADMILMRITDVVIAFPALLLAIALAALLDPGLTALLIVIAAVSWTGVARMVRGEVLSLRTRDYVAAGRALGGGPLHIIRRHLLPNLWPIIVVMAALSTSQAILLDAGLSYLGLGVPVPSPSWGRMIHDSQTSYRYAPWLVVAPGAAIVYAVLAFSFLGEGLLARRGNRSE
jgi:peptide/nickel transport system permease protein